MDYLKTIKSLLKNLQKIKTSFLSRILSNNERTDKAPSGEKRAFIVGDSIIKHINGYEISGKLENCKAFVGP